MRAKVTRGTVVIVYADAIRVASVSRCQRISVEAELFGVFDVVGCGGGPELVRSCNPL